MMCSPPRARARVRAEAVEAIVMGGGCACAATGGKR
jgi:hypothetical protein